METPEPVREFFRKLMPYQKIQLAESLLVSGLHELAMEDYAFEFSEGGEVGACCVTLNAKRGQTLVDFFTRIQPPLVPQLEQDGIDDLT